MENLKIFLGLLILHSCHAKLPKSIKVCSRNHPKLNECIIDAVKEIQPLLASGVLDPEFIVPALEPLKLDNIKMDSGREFKALFSNLSVTGGSNFKIDKMRANLQNLTFNFIITLPKLVFKGKYALKMKILVIDIAGKGNMNGTFYDSRSRVEMKANRYEKDGQTFIKFEKFKLKIQIGRRELFLENILNGLSPELEKFGNEFINENSEIFLGEVIPGLEENLSLIFTKTANEIVENASFDEMYPDIPVN